MKKPKPIQWERFEQQAVVRWFRLAWPDELLFAIPNQLVRNPYQAASMALSGLVAGLPDIMVAVKRGAYGGCFIELKAPKTPLHKAGVVSERQQMVIDYLNGRGYRAVVCYGAEDAIEVIKAYMSLGD